MALDHPNTIQRTEIICFNALKRRSPSPARRPPLCRAPRSNPARRPARGRLPTPAPPPGPPRPPPAPPPPGSGGAAAAAPASRSASGLRERRSSRAGLRLRLRPPGAPQQPRRPPAGSGSGAAHGSEGGFSPTCAAAPHCAGAASGRRRRDARGQRAPAADAEARAACGLGRRAHAADLPRSGAGCQSSSPVVPSPCYRRSTMPQQGRPTPQRSVPRRPVPSSTYSASRFTRRTATLTTGAAPRYKRTRGCTQSSAAPHTVSLSPLPPATRD